MTEPKKAERGELPSSYSAEISDWSAYVAKTFIEDMSCQYDLCEFRLDLVKDELKSKQEWESYKNSHPLVYSLLCGEERRTSQLLREGAKQIYYPKSNHGWWSTLAIAEGRSIEHVFWVWLVVVVHAILFTCVNELVLDNYGFSKKLLFSWDAMVGVALNATLGLLLVFRLNRAATRWWLAREMFGVIIAKSRTVASGLLVHGSHDAPNRDAAIRWMVAYCISVAEFLRGCKELNSDIFAGLLSEREVKMLEDKPHPPLFAAEQARHYMKRVFFVTEKTPLAVATAWSHQLSIVEDQWTILLDKCGGMERIKATPLPIVYVSHLRTFLIVSLLLYPYIWGHEWRWGTIPSIAIAAFALLGIEAASAEVEQPFRKLSVNALNMSGYCIGIASNVQQMTRQHADRDLEEN